MKIPYRAILIPALAISAVADDAPFQARGFLLKKSGELQKIWLVSVKGNLIRYRNAKTSKVILETPVSEAAAIHIDEPPKFTVAMDLYQSNRFSEAKLKFIEVKEHFKPIDGLENNPSSLAAFYEMECLRRLGDLEGLAAARQNFNKEPLTREYQLRQLEIDGVWDAVRTKSWDHVVKSANEWVDKRLPGDQRAQIAYCDGLALEALEHSADALLAYHIAVTAGTAASAEIARLAALHILGIHNADLGVQAAMKLWCKEDEDKASRGDRDLREAVAIACLYELSLGDGSPLPIEFRHFLQYQARP
ncbi:MAG: hypothetical protein ABI600_04140 [Luteolibacter sp.]